MRYNLGVGRSGAFEHNRSPVLGTRHEAVHVSFNPRTMKTIKNTIKKEINQVLSDIYKLDDTSFQVEYPPQEEMGDYSCNIAMVLAKKLKKNPMEVGEEIARSIKNKMFESIKVVKPGFINFYLASGVLNSNIEEVLKKKDKYGELKADKKLKIQVEFISANPTGPLTLANGRGGFSGDILANVLTLAGHKVEREYLINNWGGQVRKLGHSILKDDQKEYSGDYIDELAKRIKGDDPEKVGLEAAEIIVEEMIKPTIEDKMKIKFDKWFEERKIHESGEVDKVIEEFRKKDLIYEKENASWFKSSKYGDEKDRVIIKADGDKTYIGGDIAYHKNKFERGFDKVINIWGADHHGDVARLLAGVEVLGYKGQLEILLMQMMRLIKKGKEVRMSKRAGVYVTMDELIDEVGLDVTRFFFLMHANNKAMDFDLDLAKEKSSKNPVFYVQYAHARICSIINKTKGLKEDTEKKEFNSSEKELIKELIKWPELVDEVSENYEVHKLPFYAMALADKFHDFYENSRVIEEDRVIQYRLEIIKATKQVLSNVLSALGVSAPEKM